MTKITGSCPTCGEVEFTDEDVELRVCNRASLSYYCFMCPSCSEEVCKPAGDHVISRLMSAGVRAQVWQIPAEAMETHNGPPLGYDDLLEFALRLSASDNLSAIASRGE